MFIAFIFGPSKIHCL